MTIGVTAAFVQEQGDGAQVAFNYSFQVFTTSDIAVYKVNRTTTVATLQSSPADYTATVNASTPGGVVTFVVAPLSTEDSLTTRGNALEQPTVFPTESNFPETSMENELDRSRMIDQLDDWRADRSIKLPKGTANTGNTECDEPVDLGFLRWNDTTKAYEHVTLDTLASQVANPMTAQGDIIKGGASGAAVRQALGAVNTLLGTNAAGDNVEYRKLADADVADATLSFERLSLANFHGALPPDLIVKNGSTAASTIDIDWSLGGLFVRTATEAQYVETGNLTADITASGANGLDTGAEASGTWYNIFVIAKVDGTVASLLSTSSTAPTLPSGYTFKRLIGAVRNDGSSDFLDFNQFGTFVKYDEAGTAMEVVAGLHATTFTDADCSALVPPISRVIRLYSQIQFIDGTTSNEFYFMTRINGSSVGTPGSFRARTAVLSATLNHRSTEVFHQVVDSSQVFEWKWNATPSGTKKLSIKVEGFTLQI